MAWQSIAEWQARHSPEYITAQQKLLMQRQIAHEVEDRRYQRDMDMFRHQANMQEQRDRAREEAMLSVERERGKNKLVEINAELDAKIRLLGTEAQIAAFNRISDELARNKEIFRDWLKTRADFRSQAQMAILNALIAKKTGVIQHQNTIELKRLEAELQERKAEIDELTRRAFAYAEVKSKADGDAAAAKAINDLVREWERNG